MFAEKTYTQEKFSLAAKVKDYALFIKLRLSSIVVISSILGYLLAVSTVNWTELMFLFLGGFLVTGASNGYNQVLERELDRKMERTANRPMPQGRMSVLEGTIFASLTGIAGVVLLWVFLNPLCAILSALALFVYVAVYTPLKRITPFAVFVGAFPGAIPPMLGWVAATGHFGVEAGLLFAMQFMWQFPHFWAIAWVAFDDYKKAGFMLLPSKEGKGKASAFQIVLYSMFLIPVSLLPWVFNIIGDLGAVVTILCGTVFALQAFKLYRSCEKKDATRLMIASFFYLPIVQIIYVIDKL